MPAGTPLTYDCRYDGSQDGLPCCLFETYKCGELPQAIYPHEDVQQTLYPALEIATNSNKAGRVKYAMLPKISSSAKELAEHAFLTCLPQKELWVLRFLRLVFRHGPTVMNKMTWPVVYTLNRAVPHLQHESHQHRGFIHFSVSQGAL